MKMFKKRCPRCEKKINKNYEFCPYCGLNFKSKYDEQDFGMLGKNDVLNEPLPVGGSFIDKLFNNAMKMIEKQMKNMPREFNENPNRLPGHLPNNLKVQFFVNGKRVIPENQNQFEDRKSKPKTKNQPLLTPEKRKKLSDLPKKEPQSKVRRLSGKIVYELEVPGVKNVEDILINQLESSIEIKALSNDTVYQKTLNINLPILRYQLQKGNLILELKAEAS